MDNSGGKTGVKQKLKSVKAIYFAYKITLRPVRIIFNFIFRKLSYYPDVLMSRKNLEKICKKYPDYCVITHKWAAIGDVCFFMAYMKTFREKIGKKILIISASNLKPLFERFSDYDEIIYLKKSSLFRLNTAFNECFFKWKWYENARKENRLVSTNIDKPEFKQVKGFYWLDALRDVIYKIPEDSPVQFPAQKKTDVPLNQKRILVNPFSNSSRIPVESMTEIIDFFRAEGYAIFTNCVQADSFCFDGTERYCKSFMELYDEADSFEYIVSIRSGIVDLLASRNLRKIVLLDTSFPFNDFDSLVGNWKCDALEMDFDAPDRMERIKKFVEEKS